MNKNTQTILLILAGIGLLALAGYGIYKNAGMKVTTDAPSDKKVLYWHDPMVPGQQFDKPGKSPFMDMELVPVYAENESNNGSVTINPNMQQSLGIRIAEAVKGHLTMTLQTVGNVAYNEGEAVIVQARATGFVEKLQVRASGEIVRKGQPVVTLLVPEWVTLQEEYLVARKLAQQGINSLVEAARQRMRLAGMSEEHIGLLESTGKAQTRLAIKAPESGVVSVLEVREGMTVMPGTTLFKLNGLNPVWINAEVPEALASHIQVGNEVKARTTALPNGVFKGKVNTLLPEVNATTRTLKARIELANPKGELVPGMFVSIDFAPTSEPEVLLVPSEAIIQTGQRTLVMVAENNGQFTPLQVEIGRESQGQTEVLKGLTAGQKVVVSGQFLIDSEASLKGATTRLGNLPMHRGE